MMQKRAVFHLISMHSLNISRFISYFVYELLMSLRNFLTCFYGFLVHK